MEEAKMIPVIKFTGDYESLLSKGFTFQKLYAAEYPCYHNYTPERESKHCLWIWQNEGKIEFDSFGRFSATILKFLEGKTFKDGLAHVGINRETKELFEVTRDNDAEVMYRGIYKKNPHPTDEELDPATDYYAAWFDKYDLYYIDVDQLYDELKNIEGMYNITQEAL